MKSKKGFTLVEILVVLAAIIIAAAGGMVVWQKKVSPTNNNLLPTNDERLLKYGSCKTETELGPVKWKLVEESKEAILQTGFSTPYFDQHFCVVFVDNSDDIVKRVQWKYSINEYEVLYEEVFSSRNIYGEATDFHSASNLGTTHDIQNTMSKTQAVSSIKSCIGDSYDGYRFHYGPIVVANQPKTSLYLIAWREGKCINGTRTVVTANLDLESGLCTRRVTQDGCGPR